MMGSRSGPSRGGAEVGLPLLCSHLGRDWTLDKPKHQTRTLSFDIPSPCQRSTFLLPPLSPPKMGGGGAGPSCPRPSPFHEPGPPWAVLGSELGDLTRCHSGPCHPWARGPRWGGREDVCGWTSFPTLIRTRNCPALCLQFNAQTLLGPHRGRASPGPAERLLLAAMFSCRRVLSARQTHFSVSSPEQVSVAPTHSAGALPFPG